MTTSIVTFSPYLEVSPLVKTYNDFCRVLFFYVRTEDGPVALSICASSIADFSYVDRNLKTLALVFGDEVYSFPKDVVSFTENLYLLCAKKLGVVTGPHHRFDYTQEDFPLENLSAALDFVIIMGVKTLVTRVKETPNGLERIVSAVLALGDSTSWILQDPDVLVAIANTDPADYDNDVYFNMLEAGISFLSSRVEFLTEEGKFRLLCITEGVLANKYKGDLYESAAVLHDLLVE